MWKKGETLTIVCEFYGQKMLDQVIRYEQEGYKINKRWRKFLVAMAERGF